ncbi:parallel beta-helix repeat protein [Pseudomonas sp. SLBN-26]|uniref:parallel beta-helix domain-containing protein n=1 Tax=Pseudomonadaceae TaxID=135621 RepID=UPI0011541080|nr:MULTISPECIES: parallel beta-helix domain-containing protein [Pseudomonas]MCP1620129.1 parallel beta-helix repeat protein [Pseudomonas otitidis]MDU9395989.1 parallel beta-helix domain-containing protein [Pseudomonas sp. zfem003]TQL09350.1 parallel beta-helix repeat protein [Pseudomonas sp. SLBN-26]
MKKLFTLGAIALSLTTWQATTQAAELRVEPGQSIQDAVRKAQPGDTVLVEPGRYVETVFIDKQNITLKGVVRNGERPVLDGENRLNDGVLAAGHGAVIQGLHVKRFKGNAIMTQGANNFQILDNYVEGAFYGIFPQFGKNGLVKGNEITGAEDAGIYVGMSDNIDVIGNKAHGNVIGLELENTRKALMADNDVTGNSSGIVLSLIPGLPVKDSRDMVIKNNRIVDNNLKNFAPASSIAAGVPEGSGILIVGADEVSVEGNLIENHHSVGLMVVDTLTFGLPDDPKVDPYPDRIQVLKNTWKRNGEQPSGVIGQFIAPSGRVGFEIIATGKEKDSCTAQQDGVESLGTKRWSRCTDGLTFASLTSVRPEKPIPSEPLTAEQKGRFTYLAVCTGCHAYSSVLHGPSMQSIQALYKDNPQGLVKFIAHPERKRSDFPEMPPQAYLGDETLSAIAHYILNDLKN